MQDHRHGSQAVLPAVEALQLLASSARSMYSDLSVQHHCRALFSKFLYLDHLTDGTVLKVFNEVDTTDRGSVVCKLVTKNRVGQTTFSRLKEHVSVEFMIDAPPIEPPLPAAAHRHSGDFEISAVRLYRELVPFGPAYRNLIGSVRLSRNGADADIVAPAIQDSLWLLGSPFPLDAAFHAACAWGQRYAHIVGFPIGFDRRHILLPTGAGRRYTARIQPVAEEGPAEQLTFDIRIYDADGQLCEAVYGVHMRDVSGGRNQPPQWVQADVE